MQSDQIDPVLEAALLRKDLENLTEKVEKLSTDVENLVKAWDTANYVVVFVKWLASAGVAITAAYTFLDHIFRK